MKKTIRCVSIVAAFMAFAMSTVDLDIHEEYEDTCELSTEQPSFQQAYHLRLE